MLDDLPADRQAEAGALRLVGQRIADLLEAFEDLGLIGRRNAETGIDDADDEIAAAPDSAARDRARVGELDRVRDQVDDDLDQAVAIAGDHGQVRSDVLDQPKALLLEER